MSYVLNEVESTKIIQLSIYFLYIYLPLFIIEILLLGFRQKAMKFFSRAPFRESLKNGIDEDNIGILVDDSKDLENICPKS